MLRIVIYTQIHENYGAHSWDGKGDCPQYWKAKGGEEYTISISVAKAVEIGAEGMAKLVADAAKASINKDNDSYREYVIDWELLAPSELTNNEKMYQEDSRDDYPMFRNACYLPTVVAA